MAEGEGHPGSQFSLGQWILLGCLGSNEWSSTLCVQAALTGLSEDSKDKKTQGGRVWGPEGEEEGSGDRYDLDTLHTYMKSSKNETIFFKKICCNPLYFCH